MKIQLYSKTGCPYCTLAKQYLAARELPFDEILCDDRAERERLYDGFGLAGGARTMPQIVVDGERIGGYTDLKASGLGDPVLAGRFDEAF